MNIHMRHMCHNCRTQKISTYKSRPSLTARRKAILASGMKMTNGSPTSGRCCWKRLGVGRKQRYLWQTCIDTAQDYGATICRRVELRVPNPKALFIQFQELALPFVNGFGAKTCRVKYWKKWYCGSCSVFHTTGTQKMSSFSVSPNQNVTARCYFFSQYTDAGNMVYGTKS